MATSVGKLVCCPDFKPYQGFSLARDSHGRYVQPLASHHSKHLLGPSVESIASWRGRCSAKSNSRCFNFPYKLVSDFLTLTHSECVGGELWKCETRSWESKHTLTGNSKEHEGFHEKKLAQKWPKVDPENDQLAECWGSRLVQI